MARSSQLRVRVRTLRNRWFNQELKQVEAARRQLSEGAVDVLVLSDSSSLSGAVGDPDRAMIPELISRELGGARVTTIAAPGFNASMHDEILRVLGMVEHRPRAVVLSAAMRPNTGTHVREHPVYKYAASRAELAAIQAPGQRVRSFARGRLATDAEYEEFEALPVTSRWGGQTTIGHYRDVVQGVRLPQPWPEHLRRSLFDYFHGELVAPDHVGLSEMTALGARLRSYGVPAALYWVPPPLSQGELLFPGEFADHVNANWALHRAALLAGNPELAVLEPDVEEVDFQDAANGTEHYAYSGRLKIARALAEILPDARRPLGRRSQ